MFAVVLLPMIEITKQLYEIVKQVFDIVVTVAKIIGISHAVS